MENGNMARLKVLAYKHGRINDNIRVSGFKVSIMGMGNSLGLMDASIWESFVMIRSMGMVYTNGQEVNNTLVCGSGENNMAKEYLKQALILKDKEFGSRVNF